MSINAKHIGWLLTGAAAGAAAGLLLAPRKGSETRKELRDQAGKARARLENIGNGIGTHVSHALESARKRVEDGRDRVGRALLKSA